MKLRFKKLSSIEGLIVLLLSHIFGLFFFIVIWGAFTIGINFIFNYPIIHKLTTYSIFIPFLFWLFISVLFYISLGVNIINFLKKNKPETAV